MQLKKPGTAPKSYLRVQLTGKSDTGKTHTALNFPGPIVVIDFENRAADYMERPDFAHFAETGAIYSGDEIDTTDKIMELLTALKNDKGNTYKTLVIDSLSLLYHQLVYQYSWATDYKTKTKYIDKPSPEGWQKIKIQWKEFTRLLYGLPMNVVMITHDKDGIETRTETDFSGREKTKVEAVLTSDADSNTDFVPNIGVRLTREGKNVVAEVIKQGSSPLEVGTKISNFSYANLVKKLQESRAKLAPAAPAAPVVTSDEEQKLKAEFADCKTQQEAISVKDSLKGNYTETLLRKVFTEVFKQLPKAEEVAA